MILASLLHTIRLIYYPLLLSQIGQAISVAKPSSPTIFFHLLAEYKPPCFGLNLYRVSFFFVKLAYIRKTLSSC